MGKKKKGGGMMKRVLIPLMVILLIAGCRGKPEVVEYPNKPPVVYFANVPPEYDTLSHAVKIYWYGYDPDGMIVKFFWAVDDTIKREDVLNSGWHGIPFETTLVFYDTVSTEPLEIETISSTRYNLITEEVLAFSAPQIDTAYEHTVYIKAMDDDSAFSEVIAKRIFVKNNYLPHPSIIQVGDVLFDKKGNPSDSLIFFVREDTTPYWKGITFYVTSVDSDRVFKPEYSYRWDGGEWSSWTSESIFYFTGADVETLMTTGYHTFEMLVRDDAWAISKETLRVRIKTIKREWVSDTILLIDETEDGKTPYIMWKTLVEHDYSVIPVADSIIDAYYYNIIDAPIKQIDISTRKLTPAYYDSIARYNYIIYVSDDLQRHEGLDNTVARMFIDYLNTGGHLLIWGLLLSHSLIATAGTYGGPLYVYRFSFFNLRTPEESDYEFVRPISVNEEFFPDLFPDTALLTDIAEVSPGQTFWVFSKEAQALSRVGAADPINAYIIYLYDSKTNDPLYENRGCGFRYRNNTYGVVFYTFPLQWMKVDSLYEPVETVVHNSLRFLKGEILTEEEE
ncbi:hypothetical protein DRQ20_00770 [bacterium]|nr:MAG: hypothetical protein DRQ20_00770 [bacterium]